MVSIREFRICGLVIPHKEPDERKPYLIVFLHARLTTGCTSDPFRQKTLPFIRTIEGFIYAKCPRDKGIKTKMGQMPLMYCQCGGYQYEYGIFLAFGNLPKGSVLCINSGIRWRLTIPKLENGDTRAKKNNTEGGIGTGKNVPIMVDGRLYHNM